MTAIAMMVHGALTLTVKNFNFDNGVCGSRVDFTEEEIFEVWESKKAAVAADYENYESSSSLLIQLR